jgi:hypothetical protein
MQIRTNHRSGNATYGIAYTFSKALDAADNEEGSALTWNWTPMLYRNYALAGYDRHRGGDRRWLAVERRHEPH